MTGKNSTDEAEPACARATNFFPLGGKLKQLTMSWAQQQEAIRIAAEAGVRARTATRCSAARTAIYESRPVLLPTDGWIFAALSFQGCRTPRAATHLTCPTCLCVAWLEDFSHPSKFAGAPPSSRPSDPSRQLESVADSRQQRLREPQRSCWNVAQANSCV